jgi:hypothetical protein
VTKAKLRHALTWGNDPLIVIRDLAAGTCGRTDALGCFDGAAPHRVELDRGAAGAFEADKFGLGSAPNASGRNVFVVGATLLHELCHWGNFHAGRAEAREWGRRSSGGRTVGASRSRRSSPSTTTRPDRPGRRSGGRDDVRPVGFGRQGGCGLSSARAALLRR